MKTILNLTLFSLLLLVAGRIGAQEGFDAKNVIVRLNSGEEVHVWAMDGFNMSYKNGDTKVIIDEAGSNMTLEYPSTEIKEISFNLEGENYLLTPYRLPKKKTYLFLSKVHSVGDFTLLKIPGRDAETVFYLAENDNTVMRIEKDVHNLLGGFGCDALYEKYYEEENRECSKKEIISILEDYTKSCR